MEKNPLIQNMEERTYQTRILKAAIKKNTLVCIPTGMGKTNIAILLAAQYLEQSPESKILVTAPTRPLVSQHYTSFIKFMKVPKEDMQVITGVIKASERKNLYDRKIIFATPQTIQKDLENERFSFSEFSLLVIDEIHHAVGKYSYPYIAQRFVKESGGRVLGLTASPGSNRSKIKEICRNTFIEAVEVATDEDPDVMPYVKERAVEWVEVELPSSFSAVRKQLEDAYIRRTKRLRVKTKKELLWFQNSLRKSASSGNKSVYGLISQVAQAIKIEHALSLLETQGINMLRNYFKKLDSDESRAAKILLKDRNVSNAAFLTENLYKKGSKHPKMSKLCAIVEQQVVKNPESKVIIFANYRDTVMEINNVLKNLKDTRPVILVGQREGVTQKQQLDTIQRYGDGEFNCLVTTSIGEEGLDLETADLAVFYEAVPSEIRQIQRRGRVGRTKLGKIIILVTMGTRDEAYKWAAHHKEKRMKKTLRSLQKTKSNIYI